MVRLTIDKYLDEHGITRYELAKRTDIKFQTIDKYYKNLEEKDLKTLYPNLAVELFYLLLLSAICAKYSKIKLIFYWLMPMCVIKLNKINCWQRSYFNVKYYRYFKLQNADFLSYYK